MMNRVQKLQIAAGITFGVFSMTAPGVSLADSRLASPSSGGGPVVITDHSRFDNMDGDAGPQAGSRGDYAPSEFGREPAQAVSNSGSAFADSEVQDTPANRAPAGLVFDKSQGESSQAGTTPVQANPHLPPPGVREGSYSAPISGVQGTLAPLGNVTAQVSQRGVQEIAVIANDLGFFPKTVFVTRDVPVRMFVTGASTNTLCIMMDSFQVRKQIRAKQIEEISFTPTSPGKFRFYCPVNGMEGSLVVKELSSDTSSTRLPASLDSQ